MLLLHLRQHELRPVALWPRCEEREPRFLVLLTDRGGRLAAAR